VVTGRDGVSDDGRVIRWVIYSEAAIVAAVMVDPLRAVALAAKLIAAAVLKLRTP
jgi:hypothetical protein